VGKQFFLGAMGNERAGCEGEGDKVREAGDGALWTAAEVEVSECDGCD